MSHTPHTLELTIESIRCVKQSESDGDEIYVSFALDPDVANHSKLGTLAAERVPANMEVWKMFDGSSVSPKHCLYVGALDQPLRFTITVMEMDILELIKNSLSIVGSWVDDYVGRVQMHVTTAGELRWELGRLTHAATDHSDIAAEPGLWRFRLTGNRSEYILTLRVRVG